MATRDQLRARTVPAIARLARSRDVRSTFAEVTNEPGDQTIIPVLPDDTVGYVLDRLREAGGTAVLVLLTAQTCQIAALLPASEARIAVAEEDGTVTPVHEDCQVDMFFHYLARVGTATISRVTAKLVDHGPLQLT
ncbi:MAG: hypothetical protein JO115_25645 [Pseudonocardiales bacterium]|nr:hypothetical protein [Pseudonocardiales bacterium]